MPELQGAARGGLVEEIPRPGAAAHDLRPPSRPGAPGLALPRGPRCDPEALRKRFRTGRRQDGGGHAGEAGGRGGQRGGDRSAGNGEAGLPRRRLRRRRPRRAQKEAAARGRGAAAARGSGRPGRAERPWARASCHPLGFGVAGAVLGLCGSRRWPSFHSASATVLRGDAEAPRLCAHTRSVAFMSIRVRS